MGVIFVKSSRSLACLANWIASCLWRFPSVEINLFLLFAPCLFPITDSFSKLSGEMYVCIFWLVNGILDWTGCNLIPMFLQIRMWQRDSRDRTVLQATPAAAIDVSEHFFSVFFLFLYWSESCQLCKSHQSLDPVLFCLCEFWPCCDPCRCYLQLPMLIIHQQALLQSLFTHLLTRIVVQLIGFWWGRLNQVFWHS